MMKKNANLVTLETLRDCQDWNWGENVKLTIKDIKLESTGKFYDSPAFLALIQKL